MVDKEKSSYLSISCYHNTCNENPQFGIFRAGLCDLQTLDNSHKSNFPETARQVIYLLTHNQTLYKYFFLVEDFYLLPVLLNSCVIPNIVYVHAL